MSAVLHRDDRWSLTRLVVGPLRTNCYLVTCRRSGDTLVVDPGDEPERIEGALAGRRPVAIVLTHAHWDHVQAADALRSRTGAPVLADPAEAAVWASETRHLAEHGHWDWALDEPRRPAGDPVPVPGWDGVLDGELPGRGVRVGELDVEVLATPGHTPGSVCLRVEGHLLTGDTLFPGGPGLTGWPLSDFGTILTSIETRLFALPDATVVHPGHGEATTIGRERPCLEEWRARGW